MASDWNPNSTGTKGLEWSAFFSGAITVPSSFTPCIAIKQTVSETAATARIALSGRGQSGGLYVIEAYDNETAVVTTSSIVTLTARPNEDVSLGSGPGWVEDDGTSANIFDQIDEVVYDASDYIKLGGAGIGSSIYTGRFNTGGLALTSKRILAVRMVVAGTIAGPAAMAFGLNLSGVNHVGRTSVQNMINSFTSATWFYNPQTKQPWRIADVQALDTTDEYYLDCGALTGGTVQIAQVALEVVICDENRLAFGVLDDTAAALTPNAWNTVTLTTPTAGTWTKDGSGYHLFLMRRLNSTGSFNVPFHESHDHTEAPVARGYQPTFNTTYGYVTAMGSAQPGIIPFGTRTSAPADSADAQPYFDVNTASVRSGQNAEMEFSNAAAVNYGFLRTIVNPPNSDTSALTITIRRRSDNVQMGGSISFTPAQCRATYDEIAADWFYVAENLASVATLAAATQYYVQFTSAAASSDPWGIPFVDTSNVFNAASFGGTTDRALVNGVEADQYDLYATLSTPPSTPSNFAGSVTTQTVTEAVCQVTSIPRASLTWTATALGGTFDHYELERTLDGGTTWTLFRVIETESTASALDYEAPFGSAAGYRMRVVRNDGAASAWTSTVSLTKTPSTCVLYFVSNYDPTYNLVLDHEPEVGYDFLESDDRVVHAIYGGDYHLGFIPIEDRGTRGNWVIPIAFNGEGDPNRGKAAFNAVRNIARAALPYVMVLDAYGNRLPGLLHIPGGSQFMPGHVYKAQVAATELISDYVVTT